MFFVLSKLLDLFLSPYTWGLCVLALAVPWKHRRRSRRRKVYGALGLALLFICSMPAVANSLWWSIERQQASTYREDVTYDAVILLGGVGDEEVWALQNRPAFNDNVERLTVTRDLLADGHARYVIPSGGVNDPKYQRCNEAKMLGDTLVSWGITADRIILDDQAKNTRENATLSAKIVRERGFAKVLVVTSAFHLPRAADCFRAVGLDVDLLGVDFRAHPNRIGLGEILPRAKALDQTAAATREWLGRWIYRAQGYGRGP